jgi:hypothetical protein
MVIDKCVTMNDMKISVHHAVVRMTAKFVISESMVLNGNKLEALDRLCAAS